MAGMSPSSGGVSVSAAANAAFKKQLNKVYTWYTGGFVAFVIVVAILEQMGLPRNWIGLIFLLATIGLYAGIGIMSRTSDADEYYVAGRRVPAIYNGMATGADWMSAASFIGMAGTLYLSGYGGLAFIMGWTGGYCLVALFLAPYMRKFGQFTIPDFLGERYGGNAARLVGVFAAILCSFVYVVAQIYGVGLITTRLTGVDFGIGIFLGLGGILVCSFLGGMRAVTWTQVAQYIILIIAYLIPVVWLSVKQTGVPIPQAVYGAQLQKVTAREAELRKDPKELEVIAIFKKQADDLGAKLKDVPAALAADKAAAEKKVADLKAANGPAAEITAAEKALAALPKDADAAKKAWTAAQTAANARARPLAGMPSHGTAFAGNPAGDAAAQKTYDESRRNFLALIFCLMVGTAALPHILMRYYTTPSVREARESVTWSLFFIFLLYFTAPALAVLVKYEVFNVLVGTEFSKLPAWIASWNKVDASLLSVVDINKDGILQLGEMRIGGDIIVLATPEIAGLPYVISGMVAAGGLAAALSTADGLLLTIANALSHDVYYKTIDPNASTARRVTLSKILLLVVALAAAYVAYNVYVTKQSDILFLVSAAFSFAAASFFPALVLGIFWKRASSIGAIAGMIAG
ncbi:MAG: sodium:solute symporter family protein, partial [Brachymonas sp.]